MSSHSKKTAASFPLPEELNPRGFHTWAAVNKRKSLAHESHLLLAIIMYRTVLDDSQTFLDFLN